MKLVRFKKTYSPFKKDGIYLFDNVNFRTLPREIEWIEYSDIEPYNNHANLLVIRSGGIGDLIALSVLHHLPVTVLTQKKYFHYLYMWQNPPKMKHFAEPLFYAKSIQNLRDILSQWGRLEGEDAIEQGSKENWYDIFNRAANQPTGIRRPQLSRYECETIPGTLVVSKANVINRTASKSIAQHIPNVTHADEQDWTTQEYIEALKRWQYVISTDTSAIHIREGLGLPALGIYGAFDKDSRTSGYKYTYSIQSPICSPCHSHSVKPCPHNTGTHYAPCLNQIEGLVRHEFNRMVAMCQQGENLTP